MRVTQGVSSCLCPCSPSAQNQSSAAQGCPSALLMVTPSVQHTLAMSPQGPGLSHAALLHHTFVVMTSDPITALWKRPRRAFRAADHTGEPGELAADRFIGFSPIKMLFIAFRRDLFVSNFRSQFGK